MNEITVKLKCSIEEICKILERKGFKIVGKYILDDTYYVPRKINLKEMSSREILRNAILLRKITEFMPKREIVKLTLKNKEIDIDGNIVKQEKKECEIINAKDGMQFIEAIGYKKIMNIKENDIEYEKDSLKLSVKDVINGEKLIEIETIEDNPELDTIEKLKEIIKKLQIPICENNYFVKKAEIELKKVLEGE